MLIKSAIQSRWFRILLLCAIAALATNVGRILVVKLHAFEGTPPYVQSTFPHEPFTLIVKEVARNSVVPNTKPPDALRIIAVNSHNDRVRLFYAPDIGAEVKKRDIYFANGDFSRVNDTTYRMSTYPQAHILDDTTTCPNPSIIASGWIYKGEETVHGFRTFRMYSNIDGIAEDVWLAPELGCTEIKGHHQKGTAVTTKDLVEFKKGEPDAALFDLSNRSEVVPSLLDCKSDKPCSADSKWDEERDAKYHELRHKQGVEP